MLRAENLKNTEIYIEKHPLLSEDNYFQGENGYYTLLNALSPAFSI